MGEPWDPLPFPKRGNKSLGTLFAAMGGALNAWEEVEITLAHLYSALKTGYRFDEAANKQYGEHPNFKERFRQLQTVAENHFVGRPSQDLEGELCRLASIIQGFSFRRNDIAHSHAVLIEWIIDPHSRASLLDSESPARWCLVPPHFKGTKFTRDKMPAYVLTSRELNAYCDVFWDIARAASNLSIWMIQHVPRRSEREILPRPGALPYRIRDPHTLRGWKRQF